MRSVCLCVTGAQSGWSASASASSSASARPSAYTAANASSPSLVRSSALVLDAVLELLETRARLLAQHVRASDQPRRARGIVARIRSAEADESLDVSLDEPDLARRNEAVAQEG